MRAPIIWKRTYSSTVNLIRIKDGTFYREHPASVKGKAATNPPIFPNLTFELPATTQRGVDEPAKESQHWAVIGASDLTLFLDALRGSLLCLPPQARSYPYLSSDEVALKDQRLRIPSRAIQYVGFSGGKNSGLGSGVQGAYLSARYESRREETDWSVLQYLKGETELNPSEELQDKIIDHSFLKQVIRDLRLQKLVDMPVSNLSNGQTRRARIAKALLTQPELLLLDEPFMGLDPPTLVSLSPILRDLAYRSSPLLLLALRPQDPIPDWITHLVILGKNHSVALQGPKAEVLFGLYRWLEAYNKPGVDDDQLMHPKIKDKLVSSFGAPLAGVGDSLTSRGIVKYNTYNRARSAPIGTFFVGHHVNPEKLKGVAQQKWSAIHEKSDEQKSIQDWLVLNSAVPYELEDVTGSIEDHTAQADAEKQSEGQSSAHKLGEPLIELNSVIVKYGDKTVLGYPPIQPGYDTQGLNLTIRRGSRIALLGPNGSGKTTLLSLLTSDHPQSYSLPIKFFGRARLPSPGVPGLSLWEVQSRIGHSSPEVHAFFPKALSIRAVLESAWAETFGSKPQMNADRHALVDTFLMHWEAELRQDGDSSKTPIDVSWAKDTFHHRFGVLSFGTQRLLLLLRAIIKQPDIIILDEAFSGLPLATRDKAMSWLEDGDGISSRDPDTSKYTGLSDRQALVVVSHVREEVPPCVDEWIRLPSEEEALEEGKGIEMGRSENGRIRFVAGWNEVWGV